MMHVGPHGSFWQSLRQPEPIWPCTHQLVECFYTTASRGPPSDSQFYGFMVCLAFPLTVTQQLYSNNGHMFTTWPGNLQFNCQHLTFKYWLCWLVKGISHGSLSFTLEKANIWNISCWQLNYLCDQGLLKKYVRYSNGKHTFTISIPFYFNSSVKDKAYCKVIINKLIWEC